MAAHASAQLDSSWWSAEAAHGSSSVDPTRCMGDAPDEASSLDPARNLAEPSGWGTRKRSTESARSTDVCTSAGSVLLGRTRRHPAAGSAGCRQQWARVRPVVHELGRVRNRPCGIDSATSHPLVRVYDGWRGRCPPDRQPRGGRNGPGDDRGKRRPTEAAANHRSGVVCKHLPGYADSDTLAD